MISRETRLLRVGAGLAAPALAALAASATPAFAETAWWVTSRANPEQPCGIYFKTNAVGAGRYQATNVSSEACTRLRYGDVYSWQRQGNAISLYTRSGRLMRRFTRMRGEIFVSGNLVLRRANTPWPFGRRAGRPSYARPGDFAAWWINYRNNPERPCGIYFKNNVVASGRFQATNTPSMMCRRMGYGGIYSWERRRGGITLYDGSGRIMQHFSAYGRGAYISGNLILRRANTPWPFASRRPGPGYTPPPPGNATPPPGYTPPPRYTGRPWPGDFTVWWVTRRYRPHRPCRIVFRSNIVAGGRYQATNYPSRRCVRMGMGTVYSWARRRRGIVLYSQSGLPLGRFFFAGRGVYQSGDLILRKESVARTGTLPGPNTGGTMTFRYPRYAGNSVDWCRTWSTNCGRGGATLFCRRRGYSGAVSWSTYRPGRTYVIGSAQTCYGSHCVGLRRVTCYR